MQIKKYRCQCMLYAFANALDDVSINQLTELLKHDGTEVVFPGYPTPLCHRGFHITEFVYALDKLGYAVSEFPPEIALVAPNGDYYDIPLPYNFRDIVCNSTGVITTSRHALTVKDGIIIDPDNLNQYDCDYVLDDATCFYKITIISARAHDPCNI